MTPNTEETWLRLDEIDNAIDSLQMARRALESVNGPTRWKWAILGVHHALYGCAIAAVFGADFRSVVEPRKNDEDYVISVQRALKKAGDPDLMTRLGGRPLSTTDDENRAIDRLVHEFRDGFEHFGAKSWSIHLPGMPQILLHVISVVRRVGFDCGTVSFRRDDQRERLSFELDQLELLLKGIMGA